MLRTYKQIVVALLEPCISGDTADGVCKSLKKKNYARVEAMGFSGGIWVLWDEENIKLNV